MDIINFFRTAMPMGYILAALCSSFVLFFWPLKYIFIIVALGLILSLFQALKLKDNKSEKEIVKAGR